MLLHDKIVELLFKYLRIDLVTDPLNFLHLNTFVDQARYDLRFYTVQHSYKYNLRNRTLIFKMRPRVSLNFNQYFHRC